MTLWIKRLSISALTIKINVMLITWLGNKFLRTTHNISSGNYMSNLMVRRSVYLRIDYKETLFLSKSYDSNPVIYSLKKLQFPLNKRALKVSYWGPYWRGHWVNFATQYLNDILWATLLRKFSLTVFIFHASVLNSS